MTDLLLSILLGIAAGFMLILDIVIIVFMFILFLRISIVLSILWAIGSVSLIAYGFYFYVYKRGLNSPVVTDPYTYPDRGPDLV